MGKCEEFIRLHHEQLEKRIFRNSVTGGMIMTKHEFLSELRSLLTEELGTSAAEENVRYYDSYIEQRKRDGVSEQDVLEQLGSPRLIAKSIIDSKEFGGNRRYDDFVKKNESDYSGQDYNVEHEKKSKLNYVVSKLISLVVIIGIVVVLVALIGGMITLAVNFVLPIVIVAIIVGAIVNLIERK